MHKIKFPWLILIFSICFVEALLANDSIVVRGIVKDHFSYFPLDSVAIVVTKEDGKIVTRSNTLDWNRVKEEKYGIKFTYNGKDLYYEFSLKSPGVYHMLFTKPGYKSAEKQVNIPAKIYRRKTKQWEVEDVFMEKAPYHLNEAVVSASKVLFVNKGDTVVYQADALILSDGAMLDELLNRLPGITFDKNGRIFLNGEYVSSLLLDGKKLFGNDMDVVLKNLPAYVVKSVKAYRKTPENSYIMGFDSMDVKKSPLVLDVIVKRDYKDGWMANSELAYSNKNDYLGRLFGMRYTDYSRLSLCANLNNLNQMQYGYGGQWNSLEDIKGVSDLVVGGVDYYVKGRKVPVEYNTTLLVRNKDIKEWQDVLEESFLPSGSIFGRSWKQSETDNTNLMWQNEISYKAKKIYTNFQATITHNYAKTAEDITDALFSGGAREDFVGLTAADLQNVPPHISMLNLLEEQIAGKQKMWSGNGGLAFSFRSPFTNNSLSAGINGSFDKQDATSFEDYHISYAKTATAVDHLKYQRKPYNTYLINPTLVYKWNFKDSHLTLQYKFKYEHTSQDREIFRLDSLDGYAELPIGTIPSTYDSLAICKDIANSFYTNVKKTSHDLQASYRKMTKKITIGGSVTLRWWKDRVDDIRNHHENKVNRSSFAVIPYIYVFTRNNWTLDYNIMVKPPLANLLLPVRDDNDPLNVWLGNPNLKNELYHLATVRYSPRIKKKPNDYHSYDLIFRYMKNNIGNMRTYERETGITIFKPVNMNGNWYLSLSPRNVFSLDKNGKLTLSNQGEISTGYNVELVNDRQGELSSTKSSFYNVRVSDNLHLNYKYKKFELAFIGSCHWLWAKSTDYKLENISCWDFHYGIKAHIQLPKGIQAETDFHVYSRRGYADKGMNEDDFIWNASIQKGFLNDRMAVKISGFDLLKQLSQVTREVNAEHFIQTKYNTLSAYFMAHLIFKIDILP